MNYDISKLKTYSIPAYLASKGVEPEKVKGDMLTYLSPLHTEKTASFFVDIKTNTYKDFGFDEKGGDVIDLVQRIEKLSRYKAFERVHFLMNSQEANEILERMTYIPKEEAKKKSLLLSVRELESRWLLNYCNSRGISDSIAKTFLYQVSYLNPNDQKFIALGMRNSLGSFEIRSNNFKACLGDKAPTILTQRPQSGTVSLFEGMFDFLSIFELKAKKTFFDLKSDAVIYNSLSLLNQANLSNYHTICVFFDNDSTGRKGLEKIRLTYPEKNIVDYSLTLYPEHTDLNQYLLCQKQKK